MIDQDEWGRDPAVQSMRKVFKSMEKMQYAFFLNSQISLFDDRIRRWRERALLVFEKMWAYASRRGLQMNEKMAGDIYIFSLARVMNSDRVEIPMEVLPQDPSIKKIFEEAFS
jgi:hypothetical protein